MCNWRVPRPSSLTVESSANVSNVQRHCALYTVWPVKDYVAAPRRLFAINGHCLCCIHGFHAKTGEAAAASYREPTDLASPRLLRVAESADRLITKVRLVKVVVKVVWLLPTGRSTRKGWLIPKRLKDAGPESPIR